MASTESSNASYLQRLLAEREELDADSKRTASNRRPVELDQQKEGRLSRMDALQNQAMAKGTETRRAQRQAAVKAAIERLQSGEFGYCCDCGEPIGQRRLDLDPTAARCISCAQ